MKILENFDFVSFLSVVVIGSFGLVMVWSLTPNLFFQQLVIFLIGLIFTIILSRIDIRIFSNLSWVLYLCSLLLLIATFILGDITRGSTRWIQIGGFSFQSSEAIKPLLILFFASLVSKWDNLELKHFILLGILAGFPFILIFKQPDLGTSMVLLAILGGVLIGKGIPKNYFLVGLLILTVAAPVSWFVLHEYQRARIMTFIDPYSDPLGSGYHVIQSVITVGSGEILGRGLGRGTQSHLAFLPERHTDFMFASLVEELGFVGGMILMFFYFILLWRILLHSQLSSTKFGSIVCLGVFAMLCFQVFVNIGMNMGMLPITGITLPLVSYGGWSILATMVSLGLVQSVARSKKHQQTIEIR